VHRSPWRQLGRQARREVFAVIAPAAAFFAFRLVSALFAVKQENIYTNIGGSLIQIKNALMLIMLIFV
jgi:hypothetical protein